MTDRQRLVGDTNVLVSRLLFSPSVAALAVNTCDLLVSPETLQELAVVLARPKFDRYVSRQERLQFIEMVRDLAKLITDVPPVFACRDPKDDKFLALGLAGRANIILTGDMDLLQMHPFRGISILTSRQFLHPQSK